MFCADGIPLDQSFHLNDLVSGDSFRIRDDHAQALNGELQDTKLTTTTGGR
jgi:hypothetical protein